jgi:hypothetical protein
MRSVALSVVLLLLLASSAAAQTRYEDRRRHFSFPIPSGWRPVSKEDLAEEYEEPNEGFEGLPITLAAFEKDPSQRRTSPVLVVRYRKERHDRMTEAFERLKSNRDAELKAVLAADHITKDYKIGKVTFDEQRARILIPHSFAGWRGSRVKLLTVRMLGQYCIIWLQFRGEAAAFDREKSEIDATVAGFEFDRSFGVNDKPEPSRTVPDRAPVPVPAPAPAPAYDEKPTDAPAPESEFPIAPEMILVIVAVLLVIGFLALLAVKAGEGRHSSRRRGRRYR